MVISWILSNVSDSIKRFVMFLNTTQQMWKQLEQRFEVTNGFRKYQLNKLLYETKQGGKRVNEYYTEMKVMLEELEMLNTLPPITNITGEVGAFVSALNKQKEEQNCSSF
ncbi:30S ribosomal protein S8e [Bienertia sinuspersici]